MDLRPLTVDACSPHPVEGPVQLGLGPAADHDAGALETKPLGAGKPDAVKYKAFIIGQHYNNKRVTMCSLHCNV